MAITTQGTKTVKDAAGANIVVKTIVDSADTTTSPTHGIVDGSTGNNISRLTPLAVTNVAKVYTSGSFNRPADVIAYVAGDTVAQSTTAGSCSPLQVQVADSIDQPFSIIGMEIQKNSTVSQGASMRAHIYNVLPTYGAGDNVAISLPKAGYLGTFDTSAIFGASDGVVLQLAPSSGYPIFATPVSGQNFVYVVLEQAAVYTPTSADTYLCRAKVG